MADAAGLNPAAPQGAWGFESLLRHQTWTDEQREPDQRREKMPRFRRLLRPLPDVSVWMPTIACAT